MRGQFIRSLFLFVVLSLAVQSPCASEASSYAQLGLSEEKRNFSLGELDDDVYIHGRSLYFQHGFDVLSVGFSVAESTGDERYAQSEIGLESRSYSVYLDAVFDEIWFGGSVQWHGENVAFETDEEKLKTDRDTESVALGLDLGYRDEVLLGLVTVIGSLNWQDVEEDQKLTFVFDNGTQKIQNVDIEDENISAALALEYSYFIFLDQGLDASVSIALSRSLAIEGDTLVEREISRGGRLIATDTDKPGNNTAQTNQRFRLSLYAGDFDMSLDIERVDDQSFSSSYKSIGFGVLF